MDADSTSCDAWAADGECTTNPGHMLANCCAACKGTRHSSVEHIGPILTTWATLLQLRRGPPIRPPAAGLAIYSAGIPSTLNSTLCVAVTLQHRTVVTPHAGKAWSGSLSIHAAVPPQIVSGRGARAQKAATRRTPCRLKREPPACPVRHLS